ncbi:MAG: hypothetical protein M3N49_05740 [Candidatus Eremiobacteraeota bacterium]|nr:hypothetical protein [Candidatus Eremiobacteraeota bacterium]
MDDLVSGTARLSGVFVTVHALLAAVLIMARFLTCFLTSQLVAPPPRDAAAR